MSRHLTILIGFSFTLLNSSIIGSEYSSSALVDILKARSDAFLSFQADIEEVRILNEAGREQLIKEAQANIALRKKNGQPISEGLSKTADPRRRVVSKSMRYYRYFAERGARRRYEVYDTKADSGPPPRAIRIFTGERWELFGPEKDPKKSVRYHVNISPPEESDPLYFDVARGTAIPQAFYRLPKEQLPGREFAFHDLEWSTLLTLWAKEGIRSGRSSAPGSKNTRPFLEFNGPTEKRANQPQTRVRVWFDEAHGMMPSSMEFCLLVEQLSERAWDYVPIARVEWDNPLTLSDGMIVPQHALVRLYEQYHKAIDGLSPKQLQYVYFETQHKHFHFSNIAVNHSFRSDPFKSPEPPPGTHVVDQVSRVGYITGSAGKRLHETALALRETIPPPQSNRWNWAWWSSATALVVALVTGVGYWHIRRRTSKGAA